MRNRLHAELLMPVLFGLLFVIGVIVFAAGSAIGHPAPSPASGSGFIVVAAPVSRPVMVVTTSQAFGY